MDWKSYWDGKASARTDFEFDRGRDARDPEFQRLSAQELLDFLDPAPDEAVVDAGCGAGTLTLLLRVYVRRIVALDYSQAAVERLRRRVQGQQITNVDVIQGEVGRLPLLTSSVDKAVCLSVLQYLSDEEVRVTLNELARVLKPHGALVLHVKNAASLYLATLMLAKRARALLGKRTKVEHVRPYSWYFAELERAGFAIVDYNSFNVFVVERMPRRMVDWLGKQELKYRSARFMRLASIRRHGADLKIRAAIHKA